MASASGRYNRERERPDRAGAQAAYAGRRARRRRGKRTLHYMLLAVFLLAAGFVLSFTVLFKIEAIEVVGAEKYTPDEIAAASGVVIGENLLRIRGDEITGALLERFPYLQSAEVRRKPPGTVEITLTQVEPAGAILSDSEVALVDREGKLLERGVMLIPEGVPIVKGIDTSDVLPGGYLGELPDKPTDEQKAKSADVLERMKMLRYLLDAMEAIGFTRLTNVDLTDRLNMRVIYEDRLTLELGSEAELPYKLALIKEVLEKYIGPDVTGSIIPEVSRNRVIIDPTPGDGYAGPVEWEIPDGGLESPDEGENGGGDEEGSGDEDKE